VNVLFTDVLLPVVNTLLAVGLPLPALPGVQLVAPRLTFGDGFVSLAANFSIAQGQGAGVVAAPIKW
jgi:hypothetical protein